MSKKKVAKRRKEDIEDEDNERENIERNISKKMR
jgi:hypothetical protein